jgi:hypothetical protein
MKIGVTGCSHSSRNYGGQPWWYHMGETLNAEIIDSSSRGGSNEFNIEKVKFIIDNNPDLDLFVFQLTHPARIMMGVSHIKSDERGLHSPTNVNGVKYFNFTTMRNVKAFESEFSNWYDAEKVLDFIYQQSTISTYNLEYKILHTILLVFHICESYGKKVVFFSWYTDIHELAKKSGYLELIKKIPILYGTVADFTKNNNVPSIPKDSHFGNESQKIIFDNFIYPQLKNLI